MANRTLTLISTTPVKNTALEHPDEVEVGPRGVRDDRRFVLVDGEGRRLRSSLTAWPTAIATRYDAGAERLSMRFPDGGEVEGSALGTGAELRFDYHGREVSGRVVEGPWNEPLSAMAGHPVRLLRPRAPGDCTDEPATIISAESL